MEFIPDKYFLFLRIKIIYTLNAEKKNLDVPGSPMATVKNSLSVRIRRNSKK